MLQRRLSCHVAPPRSSESQSKLKCPLACLPAFPKLRPCALYANRLSVGYCCRDMRHRSRNPPLAPTVAILRIPCPSPSLTSFAWLLILVSLPSPSDAPPFAPYVSPRRHWEYRPPVIGCLLASQRLWARHGTRESPTQCTQRAQPCPGGGARGPKLRHPGSFSRSSAGRGDFEQTSPPFLRDMYLLAFDSADATHSHRGKASLSFAAGAEPCVTIGPLCSAR